MMRTLFIAIVGTCVSLCLAGCGGAESGKKTVATTICPAQSSPASQETNCPDCPICPDCPNCPDCPEAQVTPCDCSPSTAKRLDLSEWYEKQRAGIPGHDPIFLHLIYEEWTASYHVRVSVRGNGVYQIEYDGFSGWNGFSRKPQKIKKKNGFYRGKTRDFKIRNFVGSSGNSGFYKVGPDGGPAESYPSCHEPTQPRFGARLVVFAEFARLYHFESSWTSRQCTGFPDSIASAAWRLVEKATEKAVLRPEDDSTQE